MELTSPFDFVKRSVLAVQDYTHLSLRSLVNLFRKPFYMADAIQQADLIGVGSWWRDATPPEWPASLAP
jgi:hypothetical protein